MIRTHNRCIYRPTIEESREFGAQIRSFTWSSNLFTKPNTMETSGAKPSMVSGSEHNQKTDYSRWRLRDDRGKQTWHYLQTDEQNESWPQSAADKYFLGLPTVCQSPTATSS